MDRWRGKVAVVTGAASGIGEAITHALLRNGVNVAALDVQREKLEELYEERNREDYPGMLHPIECDLFYGDKITEAFSQIESLGGVDIMVNNAGVTCYTRVIESDRKAFERLLNINVLAVAECTNKAVRSMLDRNVEGHVFNVNSVVGHMIPERFLSDIDHYNGWNLYPTSKHATVALTHTVRRELAAVKAPIRITSISPGFVKTNITKNSKELADFFNKVPSLVPEDIADALIYALGTRPEVQITELTIQRTGES